MAKNEFLWHEVSEGEKEEIKKNAKKMMDEFSDELSKLKDLKEGFVEREIFEREEEKNENFSHRPTSQPPSPTTKAKNEISEDDDYFRKTMFENAPQKNENFIITEKKGWREE